MKKRWKIVLGVLGIFLFLFVLLIIISLSLAYNNASFYQEATWRSNVMFASPTFNEDLKNCSLAYTDTWEIKGLKNNECNLWFVYDTKVDYEKGTIQYFKSFCSLPKEIYSNPDLINWENLIEENYCTLDERVNSEEEELPTFWELIDLPRAYDYLEFESCQGFKLKNPITSKGCAITDLSTTYTWAYSGDFNSGETHKEGVCSGICINKNWLAKLPSDEPLQVLVYYDFNDYGGNPKVIQTEIIR